MQQTKKNRSRIRRHADMVIPEYIWHPDNKIAFKTHTKYTQKIPKPNPQQKTKKKRILIKMIFYT